MQQDGVMMIMISLRIHCDLIAELSRCRFHYVGISHAIAAVKLSTNVGECHEHGQI